MARKGRRRRWKRNCRRMCDRLEYSDFWVVSPAGRTPSSLFLMGRIYFGFASTIGSSKWSFGGWKVADGRLRSYIFS